MVGGSQERPPSLVSCHKKNFLLQPSSATAERVFSLLKNLFGDQQQTSFGDYIEAFVMEY
jgi:hypothetical protein